jgi:hypothetical protein
MANIASNQDYDLGENYVDEMMDEQTVNSPYLAIRVVQNRKTNVVSQRVTNGMIL